MIGVLALQGNYEMHSKILSDIGVKNILEAARYAKQLGTNMSAVEQIADGLLDYQNSIKEEMQLEVRMELHI